MAEKVDLFKKFMLFGEHWRPKVVSELNGQDVKIVKLLGPFTSHHHENADEPFLVVKGRFRDRDVWLEEGKLPVRPRGVEHRPGADEEACVLLFEPSGTLNISDVRNELTAPGDRV